MILFPHAKINLGLRVTARRGDGFHDIETCFYPLRGLHDALELLPLTQEHGHRNDVCVAEREVVFSSSGFSVDGLPEENLCVRAFHLLYDAFPGQIGATRMHLHKAIPFGAGLGGGSADATAVLQGLCRLYGLSLSQADLVSLAMQLGSDTAYFLHDGPMIGTGRGEILRPIAVDLAGWWLLLVKPEGVRVSTREAYGLITPSPDVLVREPLEQILQRPVERWRGTEGSEGGWDLALKNDFEGPIFGQCPKIGLIRDRLYDAGAVYAAMSGSGSAVYGLFREQPRVGSVAGRGDRGDWPECFVHWEQL